MKIIGAYKNSFVPKDGGSTIVYYRIVGAVEITDDKGLGFTGYEYKATNEAYTEVIELLNNGIDNLRLYFDAYRKVCKVVPYEYD